MIQNFAKTNPIVSIMVFYQQSFQVVQRCFKDIFGKVLNTVCEVLSFFQWQWQNEILIEDVTKNQNNCHLLCP